LDFDYVVMPIIILVVAVVVTWLCVCRMRSLSTRTSGTWRKLADGVVLSAVVLLAVAVAGYGSFNAIAIHHFWARNPPPGQIVAVGGHKMHIYCTGSGSPAIILEAGGGSDSVAWRGVQPALSNTTRVCSYDRAGHGWSDAVPGPRDADHIAAELHQLLLQTGISGPIVLMGQSFGGIYMRDYATRYPAEIAGLIFVDSSTPLQNRNPAIKPGGPGPRPWAVSLAMILGVPRLRGMCEGPKGMADPTRKLQAEDICRSHYSVTAAETEAFDQSGQQTIHSGPYGTRPILIISHDPLAQLPQHPTQQDLDRENAWTRMQEDIEKLSTRSRRIIAHGSTHFVVIERPDLIDKEVPLFIEQIRGSAPSPTNYGSTTTE
jgi:pimeloyl-ACP methyl ester carboxylesterase